MFFTPRKICWKFCVVIFIRSVSGRGGGGAYIYIKIIQQLMYNVVCLSVRFFFTKTTHFYISAKNKDNDMKPSGYDPRGLSRSSLSSRMTLSSKCPIRNPQHPPSNPLLDPHPSWPSSNWDINTKFSGYLPWGKKTSFMTLGMTKSSMSPVRNL